jgi:apolipoprotein N-acyltransferase
VTGAQRAVTAAGGPAAPRSAWVTALPWLLALGGGVLWGLQFGRQGSLLTPWWALAPYLLLLGYRRPALLGYVHGLAFWCTSMYWIAPTLRTFGDLHPLVALAGLLVLACILASYQALAAALAARPWRAGGWAALVGPAAIWVLCEWLRGWLLSGFPWNLAAYAWVEVPGALPATAWIGSWGLSFLVVFANAGVAQAALRRRWMPLAVGLLLPLAVLMPAARWGSGAAHEQAAGPPRPVRLVQPNIPNRVPFDLAASRADYRRLVAQTRRACDQPGALVIWPESAAFPFLVGRDAELDRDIAELGRQGCALLLNTPVQTPDDRWFNSGLLLAPGAEPARYDKLHLVPFGEYVPLRGLLGFYDSLTRNAGDFSAAEELTLLPWGGEKIGLSICYEVVFPGEVAARVQQGATLLVTITNDAWYGDTFAPWQHFRAARFRAAENRRPMLRAAITGISGVIAPDGSVAARGEVGDPITLSTEIAGRKDLSPYTRWPWWPLAACSVLGLAAALRARRGG